MKIVGNQFSILEEEEKFFIQAACLSKIKMISFRITSEEKKKKKYFVYFASLMAMLFLFLFLTTLALICLQKCTSFDLYIFSHLFCH